MGSFKGKRNKGLKLSRIKRATMLRKRQSCVYSPRPPFPKKMKLTISTPLSGYKKNIKMLFTPKSSRKKIDFITDANIDDITVHSRRSSPIKYGELSGNDSNKFKPKRHAHLKICSEDTSTDIMQELECSDISDVVEHNQLDNEINREFKMPTEIIADICHIKGINDETSCDTKDMTTRLQEILPRVIEELRKCDKADVLNNFFNLVRNGEFPLNNISFLLWCDVVRWFETSDTRKMRYSDECLQFFWVGKKLFGGRFLRFMSGMKNESELIRGREAYNPKISRINFACPDQKVLRNINPLGDELPMAFKPGILESMLKYKADKDDKENSYVLMLDGKKMKRGTDVDLLGYENGASLQDKIEESERRLETLNKATDVIREAQEYTNIVNETSEGDKSNIFACLVGLLLLFSVVLKELRQIKVKKDYGLKKMKELAGTEWRKSKYAFAIDLFITSIWKIDNCIEKTLQVIRSICKAGAHLNNAGDLFAETDVIDLSCQRNLRILKSVEHLPPECDMSDTSIIKQRSEKWSSDRSKMKVTGSTLYQAIGCDTLKRQKEHFDKVVNHVQPKEFNESQKLAMQHGTESEIHHLATMCGVILPFLFPNLIFQEEGYYINDNIIVSPDGSLRSNDNKPVYAFEGKSPIDKSHFCKTTLHDQVPDRYISQTLYESRALNTEGTLYLCWTDTTSTLYKVRSTCSLFVRVISA